MFRSLPMSLLPLIPLLPAAGAALNGLVGIRAFSRRTAGAVACLAMTAAFTLSVLAFVQLLEDWRTAGALEGLETALL